MPIVATPAYDNSWMGPIAQNLMVAINGDPEAKAKAAYYGSEIQKNQADTTKLTAEGKIAGGRYAAQQQLTPDLMTSLAPLPGETPAQHAVRIAPYLSATARYGVNADDVVKANTGAIANVFAQGSDDNMRQALVMQGKEPTANFAGTDAEAGTIAGYASDKAARVANIDQAGANTREGMSQTGQTTREGMSQTGQTTREAMHGITAGSDVYMAPTDPRYNTTADHVLRGAPTQQTVEGGAGAEIQAAIDAGQTPQSELYRVFNPGGFAQQTKADKAPATGKPMTVTPQVLDGIELGAMKDVPGAVDQSNPKKPFILQEFINKVGPDKRVAARQAASDVMAKTRDAGQAQQAYLDALGIKSGSTYAPAGFLARLPYVGSGVGTITPPAGTPTPTPVLGQTSGPASVAPLPVTAQPFAPPAAGGPVHIRNDADYNALAPGASYVAPDGSVRKKGRAPIAPVVPQRVY